MWSSWINEISVLEYKSLNIHKARHPIIDHTRNIFLYIHERLTNCSRMADKCIACNKIVSTRQQAIQCDGCLKWNHRTCNTGKCNLLQFFVNSLVSVIFCSFSWILYIVPYLTLLSFRRHFSTRVWRSCQRRHGNTVVVWALSGASCGEF